MQSTPTDTTSETDIGINEIMRMIKEPAAAAEWNLQCRDDHAVLRVALAFLEKGDELEAIKSLEHSVRQDFDESLGFVGFRLQAMLAIVEGAQERLGELMEEMVQ